MLVRTSARRRGRDSHEAGAGNPGAQTDIDDFPGALERRSAPQVRIAVFRYEKTDIDAPDMIYMRDEGGTMQESVPFFAVDGVMKIESPAFWATITAAADPVHDARSIDAAR